MMFVIIVVMLSFLQESTAAQPIKTVAVEGLSKNINILCDLDRQFHPVYWKIENQIYDLYNVPAMFIVRGHEAISMPEVDRRMNGWRFQCFTVEPTNEDGLNPGQVTILMVHFGRCMPSYL